MFVIILLLVGHLIKNQNWPSTILRGPRVFRTLHSSNCIVRLITSRCFRIHSFAASSVACVMHDSEQTIVTTRCEQQQPNDDKRLIVATLIHKIICRITRILARKFKKQNTAHLSDFNFLKQIFHRSTWASKNIWTNKKN